MSEKEKTESSQPTEHKVPSVEAKAQPTNHEPQPVHEAQKTELEAKPKAQLIEQEVQSVKVKAQPIENNQDPRNKFYFPLEKFQALFAKPTKNNVQPIKIETQPRTQFVEVKVEKETHPIILPVEDKPQPVENKGEVENQPAITQPIKPTEPVKPKRPPVLGDYIKNGRKTMVVTDETYSKFKPLEVLGFNVESESAYNRERQWEAEAKRRRDEVYQEKMRDIQVQIAKVERDKAEWEYIKSLTRRDDTVVRQIYYTVPSEPEESDDDDYEDDNGEDKLDEFDDLDDE